MIDSQKFINDVVKPYDDLNALLVQRLAFQPDLSDVTRMAGALATSIRHIPEGVGLQDKDIAARSNENRLIIDVSDFWKHGSLKDKSRNNELFVAAHFEYSPEKGARFIRNAIYIKHSTLGEHDFLRTALVAIRFWMKELAFSFLWRNEGRILEGAEEFHPTAFLYYDPRYCNLMKNTNVRFSSRPDGKNWVAIDPEGLRFEIFEKGQAEPKFWVMLRKKDMLKKREAGIKTWKPGE